MTVILTAMIIRHPQEVIISLRGIHIIFVIACTTLAVFFAFWCFKEYQAESSVGYLTSAIVSGLVALGFVFYGVAFSKKVKV